MTDIGKVIVEELIAKRRKMSAAREAVLALSKGELKEFLAEMLEDLELVEAQEANKPVSPDVIPEAAMHDPSKPTPSALRWSSVKTPSKAKKTSSKKTTLEASSKPAPKVSQNAEIIEFLTANGPSTVDQIYHHTTLTLGQVNSTLSKRRGIMRVGKGSPAKYDVFQLGQRR